MQAILVVLLLPYYVLTCMQTAEPGTTIAPPTTTDSTATTESTTVTTASSTVTSSTTSSTSTSTSATTTTTAAGPRCGACLISLVALSNNIGGTGTPLQPVATCTAPGMLTVSCTAAAGRLAAMEVNPEMFVPAAAAAVVQLPLVCTNGVWVFMGARTVTLVACSQL